MCLEIGGQKHLEMKSRCLPRCQRLLQTGIPRLVEKKKKTFSGRMKKDDLKGRGNKEHICAAGKIWGPPRLPTLRLLFRDLPCDRRFKTQASVTCCPWIFWAVREAAQGFQDRTGVSIERNAPYHCSSEGHLPTAMPSSPPPLPWG